MSKFKPFRCDACGAKVRLAAGAGRVREYRKGVSLPVPADFPIPTCSECGEQYMSVTEAEALDERQKPLFAEWQKAHCGEVVQRIKSTHGVTLREIERACGVTPTYLSHVLAGRKEASATLVYLLEAYALNPSEVRRRLTGGLWPHAIAAPIDFFLYRSAKGISSTPGSPSKTKGR